ncbi:MAG: hypothetical protein ACXVH7_01750 [Thermoanaerobaculia bacterium]
MPASRFRRFGAAFCFLLVVVSSLAAQSRRGGGGQGQRRSGPGTGNPDEQFVPWKFAEKGAPLAQGPLVLYWLPASLEETKRSALTGSRALLDVTSRCIGLVVISPDDARTIEKLGGTGKLPMAVVADGQGNVVRTVNNVRGVLPPAAVEQMVADELRARDDAVYHQLVEAKRRAGAGEKDGAIEMYRKIWDDRCLYPLFGSEAQHALKDLGVVVHEAPAAPHVDPYLAPGIPTAPAKKHE